MSANLSLRGKNRSTQLTLRSSVHLSVGNQHFYLHSKLGQGGSSIYIPYLSKTATQFCKYFILKVPHLKEKYRRVMRNIYSKVRIKSNSTLNGEWLQRFYLLRLLLWTHSCLNSILQLINELPDALFS